MDTPNHQRRRFLTQGSKALALAATAPAALAACAPAKEETPTEAPGANVNFNKTYQWRMVTTWPPNFPILGESANLIAQWINEMSGGRLQATVYGGGELVPSLEAFEAVSNGGAEMGHGSAYYWTGKVQAAQFFSTVPFGMNTQQSAAWILHGGGQALWEEVYRPFNLIPFMAGNSGIQMGGWFRKEINSIADLQGLKMRIPGLGGKVLSRAGGTTMNVAGGELYTSLERNVLDAVEWVGPYHDYIMGFPQIAEYYYSPGWHEPGTIFELIVNRSKYEALPSDLQAIIRAAAARCYTWALTAFEAKNAEYLVKIREEGKVQMRDFSPEVLAALRETTREVLAELTEQDAMARKVYANYHSFQRQQRQWAALSEERYFSINPLNA